jgi:hypothetical protein
LPMSPSAPNFELQAHLEAVVPLPARKPPLEPTFRAVRRLTGTIA